jgi:hypothetical protein
VLQVRVHPDDTIAGRVLKAGRQRRLMPEVPRETQMPRTWIRGVQLIEDGHRPVSAAVVHEQKAERHAERPECANQLAMEFGDIAFLVEHRNDNSDMHLGRPGITVRE